jgi:Outer membrane efflux protein
MSRSVLAIELFLCAAVALPGCGHSEQQRAAPGFAHDVAALPRDPHTQDMLDSPKAWLEEPRESAPNQPKLKITLPMAIEMCVNNNFRVRAGAESIGKAEGDLITSSLIPNPSLFADCQLIPLQHTDIHNQLGPPEWDILVAFPIDWLVFGKRLAAMRAARLGVEVSSADFANVLRIQVSQTVDAFYEVLMDDAYFKLAERNLEELTDLEKLTEESCQRRWPKSNSRPIRKSRNTRPSWLRVVRIQPNRASDKLRQPAHGRRCPRPSLLQQQLGRVFSIRGAYPGNGTPSRYARPSRQ